MRIGITLDVGKPLDTLIDDVGELAAAGLDSVWVSQIFGPDALTLLAVLAGQCHDRARHRGLPVYPRHPQMLARRPSPCSRRRVAGSPSHRPLAPDRGRGAVGL